MSQELPPSLPQGEPVNKPENVIGLKISDLAYVQDHVKQELYVQISRQVNNDLAWGGLPLEQILYMFETGVVEVVTDSEIKSVGLDSSTMYSVFDFEQVAEEPEARVELIPSTRKPVGKAFALFVHQDQLYLYISPLIQEVLTRKHGALTYRTVDLTVQLTFLSMRFMDGSTPSLPQLVHIKDEVINPRIASSLTVDKAKTTLDVITLMDRDNTDAKAQYQALESISDTELALLTHESYPEVIAAGQHYREHWQDRKAENTREILSITHELEHYRRTALEHRSVSLAKQTLHVIANQRRADIIKKGMLVLLGGSMIFNDPKSLNLNMYAVGLNRAQLDEDKVMIKNFVSELISQQQYWPTTNILRPDDKHFVHCSIAQLVGDELHLEAIVAILVGEPLYPEQADLLEVYKEIALHLLITEATNEFVDQVLRKLKIMLKIRQQRRTGGPNRFSES